MDKNFEYRKNECRKMQRYSHKCDIKTNTFFCAYKCAESYQLRKHIANHRRAIDENQSEMCVARFFEFPLAMLDEINEMKFISKASDILDGECVCVRERENHFQYFAPFKFFSNSFHFTTNIITIFTIFTIIAIISIFSSFFSTNH